MRRLSGAYALRVPDRPRNDPAARLAVRVAPGASRTGLGGLRDGALLVRVSAPAVEGQANKAVCRTLAKALKVPPSRVTIVQGERGRSKVITVAGLEQDELDARVAALSRAEP